MKKAENQPTTPHQFCAWLFCIFDRNLVEPSFSTAQPLNPVSNFPSQIYSNIQDRWIPCLFTVYKSIIPPPPFQHISTWAASWSSAASPSRIQFPNQHLHLHQWLYKPGQWTVIWDQWKFPISDHTPVLLPDLGVGEPGLLNHRSCT